MSDYEQEKLKIIYKRELQELQATCSHSAFTGWEYKVDTRGNIASDAEGKIQRYRQCQHCSLVEQTPYDEVNGYNSEIEF